METLAEREVSVEELQEKDMRGSMTSAAVFALLAGIPLFMTNKYFNITLSKFIYFAIVSVLCFVLYYTLKPEGELKKPHPENKAMDIAVFGFLISSAVSVIFSSYKADALLGSSGRGLGFLFVLILTGLYYALSRSYKIRNLELWGYSVAFVIVTAIAFIQFFGINFGGLYTSLSKTTADAFYSTIGNINVVSSYICLCLPFLMYLFCAVSGWLKMAGLYVLNFVGFCFIIIANSDSGYIGIVAAFCAVAYIVVRKQERFYRVMFLAGAFLFSPRLMLTVSRTVSGTKSLSSLAVFLGESDLVFVLAIVCTVLAVVFVFLRPGKRFPTFLRVTVIVFVLFSVICLTGAIIYFTVFNPEFELGFLENYLRFNDKWATSRGEIWRFTMESYSELPIIQKLFGCGPDTLSLLLRERYEAQMSASGEFIDNAHNEFMNYLVNHGIVGLGFYLSMIIAALKKCYAKTRVNIIHGGLFAAVVSYAFQSVVNITQPLTTPFYFIIMFMCCCDYEGRAKSENKGSEELKKL